MSEERISPASEVKKRLRESIGLWTTYSKLEATYPQSIIMLMGPSAPCDFLVIDASGGRIIAVEVKSAASSSADARKLTRAQKQLGSLLESNKCWKAELKRYTMYGEPGKDEHAEEVPWRVAEPNSKLLR